MTARAAATPGARASAAPSGRAIVRSLGGLLLLAVAVEARRWAVADIGADGLAVGAAFGVGLVLIAALGGWRPHATDRQGGWRRLVRDVGAGLLAAAALVGLAVLARMRGPWVPLDPAASLVPWATVTTLVAIAEELVLRGSIFDAIAELGGPAAAVAVTSIAFALLHVPLYGMRVVPLDLGVGFLFAGLRLASGGVVAPAVAHVVADLAAWWL